MCNPHSSESWRARRIFLSSKQRTILTISHQPNVTKLENNTSIGVMMNSFGTEFWQFSHKGYFFQKMQKNLKFFQGIATSGCHNSQLLQINGNLLPNDPSTGCLVSIFIVEINTKSFRWPADSQYEEGTPTFIDRTPLTKANTRRVKLVTITNVYRSRGVKSLGYYK